MEILFDSESELDPPLDRISTHYRIVSPKPGSFEYPKPPNFQAFALVLGFKAYFLPASSVDQALGWKSSRLARVPGARERALYLASHLGRSLVVLDLHSALLGPRDLPQNGFVLCSALDPGFALWVDRLGDLSDVSRTRFDRPSERDFWMEGEDEVGASLIRPEVMLGTRILNHLC